MDPRIKNRIDRLAFRRTFDVYGVVISFASDDAVAIDDLARFIGETFPESAMKSAVGAPDFEFSLLRYAGRKDTLVRNGEVVLFRTGRSAVWKFLITHVRLLIAEHAVERVFVHAGVVAWNGSAIVIPGRSLQGKTTLTAELVRQGAVYYSDEYAVFDRDGLVYPCPKPLSIRPLDGKFTQIDIAVEELGGTAGESGVPVRLVIVANYESDAKWRPRRLTPARGVIELVRNAIPIRRAPEFTIDVLTKVASSAITLKSRRGDAAECAAKIREFLESLA